MISIRGDIQNLRKAIDRLDNRVEIIEERETKIEEKIKWPWPKLSSKVEPLEGAKK